MRWLLKLYPQAWRDRYEEEVLALLDEHKITVHTVVDLLVGALDANLHYSGLTEGVNEMVNRMKSGIVFTFCAFIVFGVGWGMLQRLTDPTVTFQSVAEMHPGFTVLFNAIFIVGFVAFLAFLIGGLPLTFVSVKRAIASKQRNVLIPFVSALSCLIAFVAATAGLAIGHPQSHVLGWLIGYLAMSAVLLIAGTILISIMISRSEYQSKELKLLQVPQIVILFGMITSVLLATIFIVVITTQAPQLFVTQDVDSRMFVTGVVLMALGTIFAAMGSHRHYTSTRSTLASRSSGGNGR